MNKVDINSVIQYLSDAIQSSTDCPEKLKSANILSELPLDEDNEELNMIVSLLDTVIDTEVSKIAVVRVSLNGSGTTTTDASLVDYLERVEELLVNGYQGGVPDLGFGVCKITLNSLSPGMSDDKNRNYRLKDFYLYYTI